MNKTTEKSLILAVDFLTINLAWIIFFYIRVQSGWFQLITMPEVFIPMFVVYVYWVVIFTFVGMYRTWFASSRFDEISTLFKSTFVGVFILFGVIFIDDYIHNVQSNTRILIFIYWGLLIFLVGIGRIAIRGFQKSKEVHDQIIEHPALGLDVVAYVSVNPKYTGRSYKGTEVLGTIEEILPIVEKTNSKEVIVAFQREDHDRLIYIISVLESKKDVGIKIVPDLYEILSGQAKTSQIYGMPLIDIMPELMPEWEKKLKRLLDIIISSIILIITLPVTILTSIAIKVDSRGSLFFKQDRSGMNGETFKILKFRSMIKDAEKYTGPVWSRKDDPRVTRVGKILRRVRLDEIPQMFNVMKGEMSMVGPRPERPYFVEKLAEEIPYYKRRLKVRPGITGWAQVKHKYDESVEDVKIKLRYDLFYIENMSLRMDFKIIIRTIFVVLFGKGQFGK
jgi:exopolysaccharide biosynthesis polyprenyl glycosylphosphotransferase